MRGQTRIESMYAFIVMDDDDTEGIPAYVGPDGMAMPMVGADMDRVEQLEPTAQGFAEDAGKPVSLVHFTTRVLVKQYPSNQPLPPTHITSEERNRLIALIDLLNDTTVTQLDTDEQAEYSALLTKVAGY